MGGCASVEMGSKEDLERTAEIEKEMKRRKRFLDTEVKLLLLGAGESGKSTIAKQMKIIHMSGFTEAERANFLTIIWSNMVTSMKALCSAAAKLGINMDSKENEERRRAMAEAPATLMSLPAQMVTDMRALWQDRGIQKTYQLRNQFQISDSAAYYFENLDRIGAPGYVPSEQDVLRSRVKTTGIQEITFTTNSVNFRMVDVGGQRSERKKWIHCFQDVTAVIFCVAMSEYDLKLYEDETVNRTDESLKLFDEICNSKWFQTTSIILFLNKKDLFEEKIQVTDLSVCFKDYKGGKDFQKASKFMMDKFTSMNRQADQKQIYPHMTCATDTGNVKFVFNCVKDIVLQSALDSHGF